MKFRVLNRLAVFASFFLAAGCASTSREPGIAQMDHRHEAMGHGRHVANRRAFPPFRIHPDCEIACRGSKAVSAPGVPRVFEPDATPYEEANGGLVPLLTSRLQTESDQSCLVRAVERCGSAAKIETLKAVRVRSGRWSAPLPFDCEAARGCVLSPYEPAAGPLDTDGVPSVIPHPEMKVGSSFSLPKVESTLRCRNIIRGEACYGDCVAEDEECGGVHGTYLHTALTANPGAREPVEVCGDALSARLDREKLPQAVRTIECRRYFYEYLRHRQYTGNMCAAYRATIPSCDTF